MGGQACVLYGAAEFSRDTDFGILADEANLNALRNALSDLQAHVIALPPFEKAYLERGHAIHFRCHREDVPDMRVDVMSKMRGVDDFSDLWERRTTVEEGDLHFDVMSLPDLVKAKKTQRDKDWPMIRRLVDTDYLANRSHPTPKRVEFWLRELRSPELLAELVRGIELPHSSIANRGAILSAASAGNLTELEKELLKEEAAERAADRRYWEPLRAELHQLRRERLRGGL